MDMGMSQEDVDDIVYSSIFLAFFVGIEFHAALNDEYMRLARRRIYPKFFSFQDGREKIAVHSTHYVNVFRTMLNY
ncbi:hypothetical protein M4D52_22145 [Paenibacillus lactis]|uniref:hypothetical protein n=1 Tax=Paenibacillus lactis TaxID=228574 RepID=UPI00203F95E5|nr:hypothetical protein [Paenibacillus lactis]MCM3496158.1 hypothetical protein [Paenibacillus lactis]